MTHGETGEPSTLRVTRAAQRRRAVASLIPTALAREFTLAGEEAYYTSPPEEIVAEIEEVLIVPRPESTSGNDQPTSSSDRSQPVSPTGGSGPPSPGGGEPDPMAAQVANADDARRAPITRLKYSRFQGDGGKDVDDWLEEFTATAQANLEDDESRLRVFSGLLKGEALKWYLDVPVAVRRVWAELTEAFVHTFREAGGEARAVGQLGKIRKKDAESIRKYGQRVKALMNKVAVGIAPSVAIQWYVGGLPDEMAFQIRRSKPETLREAMDAAQDYEDSAQALRSSRHKKSKGKKKRDSDSDSSGDSDEPDSDEPDSTEEEEEAKPVRTKSSKRDKAGHATVKVKVEKEDGLKKVLAELEAIKVNMAELQKNRKAPPAQRANVWCSRCKEAGHYPTDCTAPAPKRGREVTDRNGTFFVIADEEEEEEEEPVTLYYVQNGSGRGRGVMTRPDNAPYRPNPSRGAPGQPSGQGGSFNYLDHIVCYRCGLNGHYATNCNFPPPGGAMKPLPCQNCGEYGHPLTHCPKPAQPKVIFKEAQVPPRDQTGLNYGSTVGIENPDK